MAKKRRFYVEERAVKITNKNDMTAIKFAALAMADPSFDDRPEEYLCIRDGKVIGTDRYRIHCGKLETPIENGLYNLAKNTKKECVIERIKDDDCYFPQEKIDKFFNAGGRRVVFEDFYKNIPTAIAYLAARNGQAINLQYIIDACSFVFSGYTVLTLPIDPYEGIHIKHVPYVCGDMEAYIMPIILREVKIIEQQAGAEGGD
jgi:hypothetical protein